MGRKLRVFHPLCQNVAESRQGDHIGGRFKLVQACLEREREDTEEDIAEHFHR